MLATLLRTGKYMWLMLGLCLEYVSLLYIALLVRLRTTKHVSLPTAVRIPQFEKSWFNVYRTAVYQHN